MYSILMKAKAKINLTLDVIGKREDGYHELEMIMQSVNLHDTLSIKKIKTPIVRLDCNYPWLPTDERNIVYRAVKLFLERINSNQGIAIYINKKIPVGAGLGGGSADAAATLVGLNRLFGMKLSKKELMEMGLSLGADVPFCIMRGTALAKGVGEKLTPVPGIHNVPILIVKPPFSVSTARIYKGLELDKIGKRPDTSKMLEALRQRDLNEMAMNMVNVLETVTIPLHQEVQEIKDDMIEQGAINSLMSGSGCAVFGVFNTYEKALKAARYFKFNRNFREVYVTTTYSRN